MGEVVSIELARRRLRPASAVLSPVSAGGKKGAGTLGLEHLISRQVRRNAEHRQYCRRPLAAELAGLDVRVNGQPVKAVDVSASGMRVAGTSCVRIGQTVAVQIFRGSIQHAQVVWLRAGEAGLAF